MEHRVRKGLGVLVSGALLGPSAAAADVVPLGDVRVQAGPVLAADSFVYARASANGTVVERVPLSGGAPAPLASYGPSVSDASSQAVDLDASGAGFGVAIITSGRETAQVVLGGTFGAEPWSMPGCNAGVGVAVSDERLASAVCGVDVANLAGGTEQRQLATKGLAPRVAGSLVAWREGPRGNRRIVVYDLDAGRQTAAFRAGRLRGELADYDLRADGTLVVSYARRGAAFVATVSPRGRLRAVRTLRGGPAAVRVRGRRIGFLQDRGRRSRVGVVTTGGRVQIVARSARGLGHADFDFDGRRLAWRTRSGAGVRLHVRDVGG